MYNIQSFKSRDIIIPDRWSIHSYYTICPYAPDGSGRILLNCADLDGNYGEIVITASDGEILNRFGKNKLSDAFFHTGYWATWSPDGKKVYFQAGTLTEPKIGIYDIGTGRSIYADGDMEGAPPFGNPIISGLMGMLYTSGYSGGFRPEEAPVPFDERDRHGIFRFDVHNNTRELSISVNDILNACPDKEHLLWLDEKVKRDNNSKYGLTLMAYCVRWNTAGDKLLFYFGNHCANNARKEPRLAYIMTADREMKNIKCAVSGNMCHWGWHPDNRHLLGYMEKDGDAALYKVNYDGTELHKISSSKTMGHPSISPLYNNILVTDNFEPVADIRMYDLTDDSVIHTFNVPRINTPKELPGRHRHRVCTHPVFSADGKRLLVNVLDGKYAHIREFILE